MKKLSLIFIICLFIAGIGFIIVKAGGFFGYGYDRYGHDKYGHRVYGMEQELEQDLIPPNDLIQPLEGY